MRTDGFYDHSYMYFAETCISLVALVLQWCVKYLQCTCGWVRYMSSKPELTSKGRAWKMFKNESTLAFIAPAVLCITHVKAGHYEKIQNKEKITAAVMHSILWYIFTLPLEPSHILWTWCLLVAVIWGGWGWGHKGPHHYFVVIALMIIKFATGTKFMYSTQW